ncbi:hypothetical protein BC827DRAFT_132553 [Russula dissimulans]|nr:hypothetical protein BC827DRAFT_132553 [Russula dissimulans]
MILRTRAGSGYGRRRATRNSRSGDSTWMRNARTAACPSRRPTRLPSGASSPTRTGNLCARHPIGNLPCPSPNFVRRLGTGHRRVMKIHRRSFLNDMAPR